MASLSTDVNGLRRIQFIKADGAGRGTVRMGRATVKVCETVKGHIEAIIEAQASQSNLGRQTADWLGNIDAKLHRRLVKAGLATPRARDRRTTLGGFLDQYIASRTDIKPNTKAHLERARGNLVAFFGEHTPLTSITEGGAEEFRRHLRQTMAPNTVARICGRAKQYFRSAVRHRILAVSPFGDMKGTAVKAVKDREHFISRDVADQVINACPDVEWRLLFALSRYGGLRCPSEHLALRWGDVDWERGRMRVTSPKTAHHEGKDHRWIPIFPELRPRLEAAYDAAPDGAEFVINRYRSGNANLRTQLERIIRRAGLEPWPKPFQNLRSTRETELAESFPMHVVCAWIGNSERVARDHYLQVTDEHFEKAAQKAAQHTAAGTGNGEKREGGKRESSEKCAGLPLSAHESAPPVGAEHLPQSPHKTATFLGGGAESGAQLEDVLARLSPELRAAVERELRAKPRPR